MLKLNRKSVIGVCAAGVVAALVGRSQAAIVIDDGTGGSTSSPGNAFTAPGVTSTGNWQYRTEGQSGHTGTYNDTGMHFALGGDDTATYTASIPTSGLWSVEAYMTNTLNSTPTVAVSNSSGTQNLTLNQAVTGATDGWLSLGVYALNAGNNTYQITSGPANTSTDAVRWAKLGVDTPTAFVVDSGGAGVGGYYSETGTWTTSSLENLYDNSERISTTLGSVATTTAPLELAIYDISITWAQNSSRPTNALLRVTDADGDTFDHRVNQTLSPVGGGTEFGVDWYSLGTYAFDRTSSVQVIRDALTNGTIASDGVRFTYVSAVPEPSSVALLSLAGLLARRRR